LPAQKMHHPSHQALVDQERMQSIPEDDFQWLATRLQKRHPLQPVNTCSNYAQQFS